MNLHINMQPTQWQMEPHLAAPDITVSDSPEAEVVAQIKLPVAGPRGATAGMIIKTPAPLAGGLRPMLMADTGPNLGGMMALTSAGMASR